MMSIIMTLSFWTEVDFCSLVSLDPSPAQRSLKFLIKCDVTIIFLAVHFFICFVIVSTNFLFLFFTF